jgi:WD40-like Beta Propeller Repeat
MGKLFVTALVVSLALATACAHHGGDDDDDATYTSVRVVPDPVTLVIPLGGSATQNYTVLGTDSSGEHDITAKCGFSIDGTFGAFNAATLTASPHGGTTQVSAACGTNSATATLQINLAGSQVVGTAPTDSDQLFGNATLGTTAANTPAIEYPIDQAVAPLNIPAIEIQYTTANNDLFHIHLASTYAALDVYTTDPQNTFSEGDWIALANTAVGDKLVITVEGLAQAAPTMKFASTPVTFNLSHDTIDTSAIYWWSSSTGSIESQTFGQTTAPTVVKGNCSGCHSLSRTGSRIGYCRCVGGDCGQEWVGYLKYDDQAMAWNEQINADNKTIHGTYTTFAPLGNPFPDDTQAVSLVTTSNGKLQLYDPDTGAVVPSNIAAVAPATGRSGNMPDWSPDGNSIVYASSDANQSVDVSNSSIALMSYSYAGAQHTFGTPTTLVPSGVSFNNQAYTNLFFPSFSPDNQWVVFNAARATWRNFTDAKTAGQRLMLVNPAGGAPIDLTNMNGGTVDHDTTWPHWAPGSTSDYYWIVFSSERDYGHEVTLGTSVGTGCVANGVKQCKQIWIGAISKAALMSGNIDPSFAPVWVPGQGTKNDNISPYWTVPAGLF